MHIIDLALSDIDVSDAVRHKTSRCAWEDVLRGMAAAIRIGGLYSHTTTAAQRLERPTGIVPCCH